MGNILNCNALQPLIKTEHAVVHSDAQLLEFSFELLNLGI